jgi:hypothetical protein
MREKQVMRTNLIAAVVAGLALAGCDAATQIAGDAIEGEVRNAVAVQCQQVAEGAGIVAGRVSAVCECVAGTFASDNDLTLEDVRTARIEGIVNQCATQTGNSASGADSETPTEETGG